MKSIARVPNWYRGGRRLVFLLVLLGITSAVSSQEAHREPLWIQFKDGSQILLPPTTQTTDFHHTVNGQFFIRIGLDPSQKAWIYHATVKDRQTEKLTPRQLAEQLFEATGIRIDGWRPLRLYPNADGEFMCKVNRKDYMVAYSTHPIPFGQAEFFLLCPVSDFPNYMETFLTVSSAYEAGPPTYQGNKGVSWKSLSAAIALITLGLLIIRMSLKRMAQIASEEPEI